MTSPWASRSVLITGHTGFKGSWLALWLNRLGARVHGYSLPAPTKPSHFEVSGVREVLASHQEADVRDRKQLSRALAQAAPDAVFHLAAQPLVRESYRLPIETFDVNVIGTLSLLEAVRAWGRPCAVLIATSDKCYELNGTGGAPRRETDLLGGHDPYSASKAAAEIAVASYRRSFFPEERLADHGVSVASLRAGNVIGGGDWAKDRIVCDLVSALAAGKPAALRNPDAVRPWQHVLEPLSGYLSLAARMLRSPSPDLCGSWNFGPPDGKEAPVRRLVEDFLRAWGEGSWVDARAAGQPHEAPALRLSSEKAARILGWRPQWSLEQAAARAA